MGKFDGLPDLPPNWLELLQAETVFIQKNLPQDPKEAAAKAQQDNLLEQQELREKCPQIFAFVQVSHDALQGAMVQSGFSAEQSNRMAGLFTLSTMALLRMLAISFRSKI